MNIENAKTLQNGKIVGCPADRGDAAYQGIVVSAGHAVNKNLAGQEYLWITVKHPNGRQAVWPSNRLG